MGPVALAVIRVVRPISLWIPDRIRGIEARDEFAIVVRGCVEVRCIVHIVHVVETSMLIVHAGIEDGDHDPITVEAASMRSQGVFTG